MREETGHRSVWSTAGYFRKAESSGPGRDRCDRGPCYASSSLSKETRGSLEDDDWLETTESGRSLSRDGRSRRPQPRSTQTGSQPLYSDNWLRPVPRSSTANHRLGDLGYHLLMQAPREERISLGHAQRRRRDILRNRRSGPLEMTPRPMRVPRWMPRGRGSYPS